MSKIYGALLVLVSSAALIVPRAAAQQADVLPTEELRDSRIPASAYPAYPSARDRLRDLRLVRQARGRVDPESEAPPDPLEKMGGTQQDVVRALTNLALTERFLPLLGLELIVTHLAKRGGQAGHAALLLIYNHSGVLAERVDSFEEQTQGYLSAQGSSGTARRIKLAVLLAAFDAAPVASRPLLRRALTDVDATVQAEARWLSDRLTARGL